MKRVRIIAFVVLMCAVAFARTAPVGAVGGACETEQPFCCEIIMIDDAQPDCGGAGTVGNFDCCDNCGGDGDHCCATWSCIG